METYANEQISNKERHYLPCFLKTLIFKNVFHTNLLSASQQSPAERPSPGDFLAEGVLPALFYPGGQAAEAGGAGDVIHEEHGVHVAIVVLHHGLTETLLSCRVPKLELVMMTRWQRQKKKKTRQRK